MNEDRVQIDVSLVNRLVAAQFPQWVDLPIKRVDVDGWDNSTFRLGDRLKVRLPRAQRYAAQVEKEFRWLPKLAPRLPLPIPCPLALGAATNNYPWPWSVSGWIDGETASVGRIRDLSQFAADLAEFLAALWRIDPTGAPMPGAHNFFRGGSLKVYDAEVRQAIASLAGQIDTDAAVAVWETALNSVWHGRPVWIHGDVAAGNLLVQDGRLRAVIDFGGLAAGDTACDLVMAWTYFEGKCGAAFQAALSADGATWERAAGWALWKALITLAPRANTECVESIKSREVIDAVLAERVR